jgi:hypothetical protein
MFMLYLYVHNILVFTLVVLSYRHETEDYGYRVAIIMLFYVIRKHNTVTLAYF